MTNNSINEKFGKRYRILEKIGEGGMGKVYKVYDSVRDKNLALKEMSNTYVDSPIALLRFKNEFRIMSQFMHPDTVRVFDFGTGKDGTPFITMEYIDGKDLSKLKGLPPKKVTDLMIKLTRALGYIHSRLYVHRDLKPDNIKLLEDGSLKLLDYGLMRQLGLPSSGKISGTLYYLAPEAVTGGLIDESTDLYSLGVIAYELLTSHRPFKGSRSEILKGHLKEIPHEPIRINPAIPLRLNNLIMKLLEKDKDKRYRNTLELLEDLLLIAGKEKPAETLEQKQGYLYSSKIVGRDDEIEKFKLLLKNTKEGKGGAVFIGAPAGLGKTRLMNEMKTLAELERFHTVFPKDRIAGSRIFGLIELLSRHIEPVLKREYSIGEKENSAESLIKLKELLKGEESGSAQEKIVKELKNILISISKSFPLVIFLDDLQWVDLKSLQVLNDIIRGIQQNPVLLVCGFRNDEVGKTSPLWHTVEEEITGYLQPAPLDKAQNSQLIDNLLYPSRVSSQFKDFCYRNSGGNVFDLMEFLRHLIAEGLLTKSGNKWMEPVNPETISIPETLEERMLYRIKNLGDDVRYLAESASVLGDDLDLEIWQKISQFENEKFYNAIDELMRNQVIVKVDGDYRFSHDKIQNILYNNLDREVKKNLHKKTAEFFETKPREMEKVLIPVIAEHYVKSGEKAKAVEASLKAAEIAIKAGADWKAFAHYKDAVKFLEELPQYPDREKVLLEIYEKTAGFSSAAWIDALTCLGWIEKAIEHYEETGDTKKVFDLSLSYVVNSAITSNYEAARRKIPEIIDVCKVEKGSLPWAILYGAGVCLVDWYQGYQMDCYNNSVAAIEIFEKQLDTIPDEAWGAYTWSVFWRDKARAYLGKPVVLENIQKIRKMADEGKSDLTIYWHSLTAVIARYAMSGRYEKVQEWEHIASQLSRDMGKIYWFECWISHSHLYAALDYGEFSQLEEHIERVQASPDPYQVRLAYLFRGRLRLVEGKYNEAEENLRIFMKMEEECPDNSLLEGYIYLAKTYMQTDKLDKARDLIEEGATLASEGKYENPLYKMQFYHLKAELALMLNKYLPASQYLDKAYSFAVELDNPIQKGFIHKTRGLMLLEQGKTGEAEKELSKAKELFLSVNNKYQAGQVLMIIESITSTARLMEKNTAPTDEKTGKTLYDENVEKTGEEQSISAAPPVKKSVTLHTGSKTDIEATEMEETIPD